MVAPPKKMIKDLEALASRLKRSRLQLFNNTAGLSDAQLAVPIPGGEWSIKDNLAHLAANADFQNLRQHLERGLILLNQTPGVQVAGSLIPGAQPGTSGLEVTLTDTPVARAVLKSSSMAAV